MLRKRIIGVVTIRQGLVVQSFGYRKYLPVGDPLCVVENLDRWGVDEILLQVIDRNGTHGMQGQVQGHSQGEGQAQGPDFDLLQQLAKAGISTPLCYCGGIRDENDATQVIKYGADRIAVDALLHDDPDAVSKISLKLGAQAVIAVMPVQNTEQGYQWFNYRSQQSTPVSTSVIELLNNKHVSELMLVDVANEGKKEAFDNCIISAFDQITTPKILFGGISEAHQFQAILSDDRVSAAACGNFLNYSEHAVQAIKAELDDISIRFPGYQQGGGLCL
ncbi:HisA/HisF-related TIM barrel protein [Bacterioplanoides sp.]|uniref:HisA/HisF-related TIM barrel protein n=1 Tax=Bacterioplanoides sp. TaxID=2066072 RepID=UPI003B006BC6